MSFLATSEVFRISSPKPNPQKSRPAGAAGS
jgi:hypothetical protein